MPVLEIEGRKVEVDDSFMSLTPEQQDATVDEIAASFSQQQQPQEQGYLSGLVDSFTQGATFNFGDELSANEAMWLGKTPEGGWFDYSKPMGERYDAALAAERAQQKAFSEANPKADIAAEITGAVLSPVNKLVPAPSSITGAIGQGAGYGAVSGFGAGEGDIGDQAMSAAKGAALGGAAGGVIGAAGKGLQSLARNKGVRDYVAAAPRVDDLKRAAGDLYDQAAQSGVVVPKQEVQNLGARIRDVADQEGLIFKSGEIDDIFPKIRSVIRKMDDISGDDISVRQLQNLRKNFQRAAGSTDPAEARVGKIMLDELDDFAGTIAPELDQAKSIYAQAKTGERVAQANELASSRAAQYSNSGMQNALRTEFRQLYRNIQKGRVKGISPDLKEQIRKVAEGEGSAEDLAYLGS